MPFENLGDLNLSYICDQLKFTTISIIAEEDPGIDLLKKAQDDDLVLLIGLVRLIEGADPIIQTLKRMKLLTRGCWK